MDKITTGIAGTLESNDVMVTVELRTEGPLNIDLESNVIHQFGKLIEKTARETLEELGVKHGLIKIVDKGALDYAIRARIITAVNRAQRREVS
ncbi:citrate lyase acyl carrier protein [Tindallia californiensis]|uniref:Citrate lyase subunit gamma (Acyl carrier protein) n=1 Tax=Tindallia californiensis TaxID=159292 RepID=A0A1H3Q944_9FIRM|nr:citrate lyase acyl carrier protein [Tindallia californiensis]SDZ09608.1 citrate lyase subunit gamma (acyl carrier protein) [Tindallia californiensis]